MIQFGGKDSASIKAFYGLPNLMFISELVDNDDKHIHEFLITNYFEKGAALFGRESREELQAFRNVCNGSLANENDANVYSIIQFFVQRLRNYARLKFLNCARIERARIVSTNPRTEMCKFYENKLIDVKDSLVKIDWIYSKSPIEQGKILMTTNIEVPPLYKLCRCGLEGLIRGVDY